MQSYDSVDLLSHIEVDPKKMLGKPVIKGTRLTVEHIIKLMSNGASFEEILEEYQDLTKEDLYACLQFASKSLENITSMPQIKESI